MICKNCGASMSEEHRFCPKCGAKIATEMNVTNPTVQTPPQSNPLQAPPENYLVWAILTTIFCCWPFGIPAIINASKVNSAYDRGNYAESLEASRKAKNWTIASAATGGTIAILYIVFIILLGAFNL